MAVDGDGLRHAGAQPPQVGDGEPDRPQGCRAGMGDAPGRDEHRIVAAADRQRIARVPGAADLVEDAVGEVVAHVSAMIFVSSAISSCGQVMCGLWLASIS